MARRRYGQAIHPLRGGAPTLKAVLDSCPSCGGAPAFDAETVESCCSAYDVAAVTCGDCEARLFEARVDG